MASPAVNAAFPPTDTNRPHIADITRVFVEAQQQPLAQPDEPDLGPYGRAAADIDISTPYTGKGGGALRPISDNFTVNPATGTLSLKFPIPISAGRSGFGPTLHLAYDSGFGNGPWGIGWRLAGVENVTRRVSKEIPKYDDSDIFVLAGAEDLIPSLMDDGVTIDECERDGYVVRQYRPRVETQVTRIERWMLSTKQDEIHWRTISSANVITIFGDSDESRIYEMMPDGRKNILTWLASYTYDPFGNAIELNYKAEDGTGVSPDIWEASRSQSVRARNRYLKSIRYGNRRPHRNLSTWELERQPDEAWMFEVVLDYGEHSVDYPTLVESNPWSARSDPMSSCNGGFEVRTYRLCRRILTFHHIPDGPERRDHPVSSTNFSYKSTAVGNFLESMVFNTYSRKSATLLKVLSMPPYTFQYSEMPSVKSLKLGTADTSAVETLSDGRVKWVDLDGEGAPGLLVEHQDAAWSYQRNESPLHAKSSGPKLGPAQWLTSQPSLKSGEKHRFEDLDGNGVLDFVYHDLASGVSGFSERRDKTWTDFLPFVANNAGMGVYGEPKRLDLTGNGLSDILYISEESNEIIWQESLKKDGFGPLRRVRRETSGPTLVSSEPTGQIYLADMSGDGMTDIVHICESRISYWPNLGYGRFGPEVVMGNAPKFDQYGQFTHARLRLGDVDGSGTTDLIYLPRNGGIKVFYNLAGNSWSAAQKNPRFPKIDNLASVSTLDLLGSGSSCLCWTGPNDSPNSNNSSLHYFDFTGGQKCHLLTEYSNGCGSYISFSYRPSTWFYLDDERQGCPWTTKLPFPVHCVREATRTDQISQTQLVTTFAYHDGYFDGEEREFRGFGRVETWDSEDFSTSGTKPYQRPQVHTKLWFYTGASNEVSDGGISYQSHPPQLASSTVPTTNISPEERREAYRALKGMAMRKEVYSDNFSTRETESAPYLAVDSRYCVTLSQSRGVQRYAIFKVNPRETLSTYYENQSGEPRVIHDITLEVNDYGDTTKSVSIVYGLPKSELPEEKEKTAQQTTIMTYHEKEFTGAVTKERDNFRKPALAATRSYRIRGFKECQLFDLEELVKNNYAFFQAVEDIAVERAQESFISHHRVCIGEKRFYYRSSDLSKRLDSGQLETFSVLDQRYDLAYTKGLITAAYGDTKTSTGKAPEEWMAEGKWVELDKDGRWWQPSSKSRFPEPGGRELDGARTSFYTPVCTIDAFGNRTRVQMDGYFLFPISITDAVGNVTHAKYSYTHLRPIEMTDANGNRTQMALDSFGKATGTARMGKVGENVGDSLEDFAADLDEAQISSFLNAPTVPLALSLLKKAGRRKIYDYGRWNRTSTTSSTGVPNFEAEIVRTTHHGDDCDSSQISLKIDYLSGSGASLQTVTLSKVDSIGTPTQWHYSGWQVLDSKGNPVRQFRPSFADSHGFVPQCNISSPASTLLYDPLDRLVGTLNENHTWSKTRTTPWTTIRHNEGSTVLCPSLVEDEDVGGFARSLDPSTYLPSWAEKRRDAAICGQWEADGAEKSKQFHNKPRLFHLDPLGRPILAVIHDGEKELRMRQEFDVLGNRCASFDTFGRRVDRRQFDLLGNILHLENIDAGQTWSLFDCTGQSLVSWNGRGICKSRVFDDLRRETELWVRDEDSNTKILATQTTYGETDDEQSTRNNLRGRVAVINDQAGIHRNIAFDFKGNCIQAQKELVLAHNRNIDWRSKVEMGPDQPFITYAKFDAVDRAYQTTNILGNVTRRDYNLMGLLNSCVWRESLGAPETTLIVSTTYSPDGQPIQIKYGNGTLVEFTYDNETRYLRRKRIYQPSSSTKPVLEDLSYSYDCQGRITHIADNTKEVIYFRNSTISASKDYSYDALGRLVRAEGREQIDCRNGGGQSLLPYEQGGPMSRKVAPTDGNQLCRYAETYVYDNEGNLKSMKHTAIGSSVSGWTRRYLYEEDEHHFPKNNRLIGAGIGEYTEPYEYNGREGLTGCITRMPGYSRIGWDYNDKMRCTSKQKTIKTEPETTWYLYDAHGARIRKVTESSITGETRKIKETLYIGDVEIYRTYENDGIQIKATKTTSEVRGDDNKIALLESNSLSNGTDHLLRYQMGNSLELDEMGNLISYEEYTPFGVTTYIACGKSITAPSKYRYNSYERDSETGLYFCNARYYSPWLGRWMSPDPIGTTDGHNIYAYVSNDPVNFTDPGGTNKDKKMEIENTSNTDENSDYDSVIADDMSYQSRPRDNTSDHVSDDMSDQSSPLGRQQSNPGSDDEDDEDMPDCIGCRSHGNRSSLQNPSKKISKYNYGTTGTRASERLRNQRPGVGRRPPSGHDSDTSGSDGSQPSDPGSPRLPGSPSNQSIRSDHSGYSSDHSGSGSDRSGSGSDRSGSGSDRSGSGSDTSTETVSTKDSRDESRRSDETPQSYDSEDDLYRFPDSRHDLDYENHVQEKSSSESSSSEGSNVEYYEIEDAFGGVVEMTQEEIDDLECPY